jgi:ppGpp synthetase/RelA/SpoT-type nucleotidyltranferase
MGTSGLYSRPEFMELQARFFPFELVDRQQRWQAYTEELRDYCRAAEAAVKATDKHIIQPLRAANSGRLTCYIDRRPGASFTKSPESIDTKIFRYLSDLPVAGNSKPTCAFKKKLEANRDDPTCFLSTFFHKLPEVMNDLARFRVVGNFLSDVHAVADAFNHADLGTPGIEVDPVIEDRIEDDRWLERSSGHRAVHLRIWVMVKERRVHVEVLVMSLLELGWDAKSHMIYESTRLAQSAVDKRTRLKVRAMSDAIYVADALFDDVFRALSSAEPGETT